MSCSTPGTNATSLLFSLQYTWDWAWHQEWIFFRKTIFSPMLPCFGQNLPPIFSFLCTHTLFSRLDLQTTCQLYCAMILKKRVTYIFNSFQDRNCYFSCLFFLIFYFPVYYLLKIFPKGKMFSRYLSQKSGSRIFTSVQWHGND